MNLVISDHWTGGQIGVARPVAQAISGSGAAAARPGVLLRIHTIGPFLVEFAGGAAQIHSRKACGLLALLALAPRGQRTRVWLRDKLWSGSDEKRAATSLRQTIFDLRRTFGRSADHFLLIDRTTIGLRLDRVWVDMRALGDAGTLPAGAATSELLEGIDVGDEEFEDWLRDERQIWLDRRDRMLTAPTVAAAPPAAAVPAAAVLPEIEPGVSDGPTRIGFLPSILYGCDEMMRFVADRVLEGTASNLQEFFPLRVIDYRDSTQSSSSLMESSETEFYMRVRLLQVNRQTTVTFLLYRASRMSLEWCQSIHADVSEILMDSDQILSEFIAQNVDRVSRYLFESQSEAPDEALEAGRAAFSALSMMFRLDQQAMSNAGQVLTAARGRSPETILPSLQSYLASFAIGEFFQPLDNVLFDETRRLVDQALTGNPFNSLALACLGHVMGYVFGEPDVAQELLERAVRLNPGQAFVWDHYALHKLYTGDARAAFEAAQTAVRLGRYSPIAYSYETTLSMAATLVGDHGCALNAGRSALGKQPRFAAAMRYQIANLGHLGRVDEAREIYRRLLAVDPGFADPATRPTRFRIADRETQTALLGAIDRVLG